MENKRIGVVISVNNSELRVLIEESITSLKKDLNGKTYYIGQIGTYILIPVSNLVLLGMVGDLRKEDVMMNGKSAQRYIMSITLAGTVNGGLYERGVSLFPPVDSVVYLAEDADLLRSHGHGTWTRDQDDALTELVERAPLLLGRAL